MKLILKLAFLVLIAEGIASCKKDIDPIADDPAIVAIIESEDGKANATIVAGCFEYEKKDSFSIKLDVYPDGITGVYPASPIPDSLRIGGLRVAVSGNIFDSKAVNRCETANDDKSLSANRIEIKEIKAENIVSVLIGQGELYGGGSEGFSREFSVIKTELEWKALKAKLNLRNNITDVFAEKNIDFSRYQVIFVIDEVKGNGGWSIDITDITENDDNIVVSIENLKTGDATTAISQPFQLVKISSSDKPVIFNDLTLGKHILPLVNFEFPEDCVRSIATLQPDSLYVINSDEEFNKYFICGSNPIDFSKKTLLFSLGETNYGIYKISTELLKESNEYSLTVDIQLTISCVIDRWNIALITDKINTQNVILNLNKHF